LSDKEAAADLQATMENLQTSSAKLDEDLEAAQHSWPLKKYFKKKAKAEAKAAEEAAETGEAAPADEGETAGK
jgi:phospholipid/cholesterol/gamma-HCH transport system substrate-binding protein